MAAIGKAERRGLAIRVVVAYGLYCAAWGGIQWLGLKLGATNRGVAIALFLSVYVGVTGVVAPLYILRRYGLLSEGLGGRGALFAHESTPWFEGVAIQAVRVLPGV